MSHSPLRGNRRSVEIRSHGLGTSGWRPMPQPRSISLALVLLASACAERSNPVVDVPFCASDDPKVDARLAHTYVWIAKGGNEHGIQVLSDGWGAPFPLMHFHASRVKMALVECDDTPRDMHGKIAAELDTSGVPEGLCEGQRVVFIEDVEAQPSERAAALGY